MLGADEWRQILDVLRDDGSIFGSQALCKQELSRIRLLSQPPAAKCFHRVLNHTYTCSVALGAASCQWQ